LVDTKKASSVEGYAIQLRDPGVMYFAAEVRQEASLDAARDALIETVETITANAITKEEVERARAQLLKQFELNLNSSEQVGIELSEWAAMGDWRLLFWQRDQLRKVTEADVQRAALAYFKPSNRTLGQFIPTPKPDRAEVPPSPDVAAMLKDYKGDAVVAAGEAFDPSPANIDARTVRPQPAGGMSLVLLPKKTRGGTVVASMILRFGDEKSLFGRTAAGGLTAEMLMRGTARRTRQQIQDEFDRLKARVGIFGGPNSAAVAIETLRGNLPAVIRLVAEILREPSFPASEFETLKQEALAAIEQDRSEPTQMAVNVFQRLLSPYPKGDARYTPTADESIAEIKGLTLDDVKKFYSDFYGASNATLSVVGDFDDKEVAAVTTELFASWKSPRPFARLVNQYHDVTPINRSIEAPDKANAFLIAGMNLMLQDTDADYPALVLANYILGGGFLHSRLATRIRQKEGLSYDVGSQLEASPLEKAGAFSVYAIYAPQNLAKLEAAFKEEIVKALKDGFTAEEIAGAKSGLLQSFQLGRTQDSSLAGKLGTYAYLGRTMAWDAELEKKIAALTPDQVVAALRRHIDLSKMTIVKAGDFAKKP
jgi:zinc protease